MLHKVSNNILSYSLAALAGVVGFITLFGSDFIHLVKIDTYSLFQYKLGISGIWASLVFAFFALITFALVKQINSKYKFAEGSIVPMMVFYIVGIISIPYFTFSLSHSLALVFILLNLQSLLRIHNQTVIRGEMFLSGFFIGLASLCFYPSAVFLLLTFATVTLFRPFELRNYFMSTVGLLLPVIYWMGAVYLFNLPFPLSQTKLPVSMVSTPHLGVQWLAALLIFGLGITGSFTVFVSNTKFIVRQRNQLIIIVFYFILLLTFLLFTSASQLIIAILPFFALFFLYFYNKVSRKWLIDLFLLLLLISSVWLKVSA